MRIAVKMLCCVRCLSEFFTHTVCLSVSVSLSRPWTDDAHSNTHQNHHLWSKYRVIFNMTAMSVESGHHTAHYAGITPPSINSRKLPHWTCARHPSINQNNRSADESIIHSATVKSITSSVSRERQTHSLTSGGACLSDDADADPQVTPAFNATRDLSATPRLSTHALCIRVHWPIRKLSARCCINIK